MKETISRKIIWNRAMTAGLVLGLVSTAYMFITQLLTGIETEGFLENAGLSIASLVLWAGKFALCIWLMAFFMKKLVADFEGVTNIDTYKFGLATAFLSALVYSAILLANFVIISPDFYESQMQEVLTQFGSIIDSNSLESLENMQGSLPAIEFFSNLIYCFLFGMILSAILSRRIPQQDPFAGFNNNQNIDNQ